MTRVSSREGKTQQELELLEFEAELDVSANKVFATIEKARNKMTDLERRRADQKADAILKKANESAEPSRRRA
jgi:hypothetical protein